MNAIEDTADYFERRSRARLKFSVCDSNIAGWDAIARGRDGKVPPISAPASELALSSSAEITVSAEWLSYLLDFLASYDGMPGGAR